MKRTKPNLAVYRLLHVAGCVEPSLVGKTARGWNDFEKEILKFLRWSEYNEDDDGLFYIATTPGGKRMEVYSFTARYMDDMRAKATSRGTTK